MFRPVWPSSGVQDVIILMSLKEPASLVFSVSCTWLRFCRFPYVFSCSIFSFCFAVPCVRVYLLVFSCKIQKKTSEAGSFKNMLG
jgi:hypothetical protein